MVKEVPARYSWLREQKYKTIADKLKMLATVHCTRDEMCAAFDGCSHDTLERNIKKCFGDDVTFTKFFEMYRGQGKVSLRKKGFSMALSGDKEMLKFHLKNHCDMADKVETTITGAGGGAVKTENTHVSMTPDELRAEAAARGLPTKIFEK